jgi:indoleacetamide hydrolase
VKRSHVAAQGDIHTRRRTVHDDGRRRFLGWFGAASAAGVGLVGPDGAAMMPRDLSNLTAIGAVNAMRRGEIAAERYARFCVERAQRLKDLNAITTLAADALLEAARAADRLRAAGGALGPLHGLPIVVKDNIDTAGLPTSAGTPGLRAARPTSDAPILGRLYAAGAILLGKTNMHELAFGYTTDNAAFGPTRNPYDPVRIPGGSSGGTAAAVAARIAPAGLGTDTVGSVRVPSALCGIAGFRPTASRYASTGWVPLSHTRDAIGPMARSVADLALLDGVAAGEPGATPALDLRGVRLGVPRGYFWADLDAEVERVATRALDRLADAGAVIVETDLPALPKDAFEHRVCRNIQLYEFRDDLARYLADRPGSPPLAQILGGIATPSVKTVVERFVTGAEAPTQAAYEEALRHHRPALLAAFESAFAGLRLDATVFPMTQVAAPPIGRQDAFEVGGREFAMAYLGRNADPGSCAGLPGVCLPAGMTRGGLPVGLALDGLPRRDRRLLAVGMAVEAALGTIPAPPM